MTPLVELRNVTKRYGENIALDRITLSVEEKEILSLLGPNGSGKTTLLRLMAGLEKPDEGEVYLDGHRVNDPRRMRRRSTMVFQRTVVFSTTVYKNIAYGLRVRGLPERDVEKKVMETLRLVKLKGYKRRHARDLSGGEQQRVSLARALVLEPKLLLLDEPTANLDPENTAIIEEVVYGINKERGTTIVMATHNIFQVEDIAGRVALLSRGKIVEMGSTGEVFRKASKHFASFARAENIFRGGSKILGEGISSIEIGGGVAIEVAGEVSGETIIYINPRDIIVSKAYIPSSARNVLRGEVKGIVDLGSVVKLRVDAGREFTVQITKQSFQEMDLNLGSHVFLIFKASSLQIL